MSNTGKRDCAKLKTSSHPFCLSLEGLSEKKWMDWSGCAGLFVLVTGSLTANNPPGD